MSVCHPVCPAHHAVYHRTAVPADVGNRWIAPREPSIRIIANQRHVAQCDLPHSCQKLLGGDEKSDINQKKGVEWVGNGGTGPFTLESSGLLTFDPPPARSAQGGGHYPRKRSRRWQDIRQHQGHKIILMMVETLRSGITFQQVLRIISTISTWRKPIITIS